MRCRACNRILTQEELLILDDNDEFEDMCLNCLGQCFDTDDEDEQITIIRYHDNKLQEIL